MKKTRSAVKPKSHEGHNTVLTETGSIRFVAGDVVDNRRTELYCLDCHEIVPEVKSVRKLDDAVVPF